MTCVFKGQLSFSFRNHRRRHLQIVAIWNKCKHYHNSDVCRLRSQALDGRGLNILIGRHKLKCEEYFSSYIFEEISNVDRQEVFIDTRQKHIHVVQ